MLFRLSWETCTGESGELSVQITGAGQLKSTFPPIFPDTLTLSPSFFLFDLFAISNSRGYIPSTKKPSSKRAETTHKRLCQHETIARTAKECCAFPELPVKSSVPGEVLQKDEPENGMVHPADSAATVADVAGELCDNFDQWARDNYLFAVEEDWGWVELTSEA